MKAQAIRVKQYGGPEVLEIGEVDVGEPGPDEIRIKQHAIGLNFIDTYYRTGLYQLPLPRRARRRRRPASSRRWAATSSSSRRAIASRTAERRRALRQAARHAGAAWWSGCPTKIDFERAPR